jgi:uncharacterized membrane-anchored protein
VKRTTMLTCLAGAVLLQLVVLCGEYLFAAYPRWYGKEVRLVTVPVDPRSLFRGNYARLRYAALSAIGPDLVPGETTLREGEVVYVRLKPAPDGTHRFGGLFREPPQEGLFLRGRLHSDRWRGNRRQYRVRCGIEAWFAPKEKALAAEKRLRSGGIAVIMVAANGRAALKGLDHR